MSGGPAADWPARLRSRRVTLRALRPGEAMPAWLEEAELAVRGGAPGCRLGERVAAGDAVYWLGVVGTKGAERVGALAARAEGEALVWTWLAVEAARRAFGYGGAAVPLVERAAGRLGLESARVLIPARNGVGLYFWLRLGYRPVAGGGWRSPKRGAGTWMVREPL